MSSVILKENETLDSESITKSLASSARKSLKQPERENITDLAADLQTESSLISIRELFLQGLPDKSFKVLWWKYGSIDH